MEQTVYVDIFFLINFSMDFLCFFITAKLLGSRFSVKRVTIASLLGGVYACASLFLYTDGVLSVAIDLAVALAMSAVAVWRRGNIREVIGFGVVYAAASVVLGGAMTVLFSLFNRLGIDKMLGSEGESDGLSVWLFVLLAAISAGATLFFGGFFKKKSTRKEGTLEIVYGGKELRLRAFCDSGNLLVDPISAKPCVIVEAKEMEKILEQSAARNLKKGKIELLDVEIARRVRVVPTHTVSGDTVLYAIKVDELRVDMGSGKREIDALVALGTLGEGADGAKALLPSSVVFGVT